jgi:hypothetical protein
MDPDGKTADIVELLAQTNEILADMPFMEGNLPTGNRTTVRTGLPAVYWRMINQGVPPSKSTTATVDESVGMLEAYSEVDKDLAELNGNTASFRLSEAAPFTEAMNQEMVQTVFYGNSAVNPEEFTGLSPRYSDITAKNGKNIIKAGGVGSDNASIWLIGWGANGLFGTFPKGSKAGLSHEDLGLVTVETTAGVAGNRMRAYQDHWQWKNGIVLKDWRNVVRIANIDVSDLVANSGAQAKLLNLMAKATHRLQNKQGLKPVFYMNRTVFQQLDVQRLDSVANGGGITYENVDGRAIPSFRGFPIKLVDSLLETEAAVL